MQALESMRRVFIPNPRPGADARISLAGLVPDQEQQEDNVPLTGAEQHTTEQVDIDDVGEWLGPDWDADSLSVSWLYEALKDVQWLELGSTVQ